MKNHYVEGTAKKKAVAKPVRKAYGKRTVPQSQPARKDMVANNAGGFTFALDSWDRLQRFLILGSESGTYYVGKETLLKDNLSVVKECIKADGKRAVQMALDVSLAGRAPKNDPALLVHALASVEGDLEARKYAYSTLTKIARIGTHLFHWAHFRDSYGGWGAGTKKAVSTWYLEKDIAQLQYQVLKYQQRDGWSHADLIKLAHPAGTKEYAKLFDYLVHGTVPKTKAFTKLRATLALKELDANVKKDVAEAIRLIESEGLTFEMIPTEFHAVPEVWQALLPNTPVTATIRNLGRLTSMGLLTSGSAETKAVIEKITDVEALVKGRVHPLNVLFAMSTYKSGHGLKGSLTWSAVPKIVDALDEAFYASFGSVETSGKRIMLALDVSGSMGMGYIAGTSITPREATAALAMVTARVESDYSIFGFSDTFRELDITPKQRLDAVIRKIDNLPFARTDCALPMLHATDNGLDVDAFVIYTDNETWAGRVHPHKALQDYRKKTGIPAKMIVVGMTATGFTIADPKDAGMLDVVGFDTSVPNIMADFIGQAEEKKIIRRK
jgi:60 kDa SS-A/Ro ribonucleoprotein